MKEHSWKTEEIDYGIDICDVTFCTVCDAHQSFLIDDRLFYPGTGITLPNDCDEAKKIIEDYQQTQRDRVKKAVRYWDSIKNELDKNKVPLPNYLGWSEKQLAIYLVTGQPPYEYNWGYSDNPKRLYECNNKCHSCCVKDDED